MDDEALTDRALLGVHGAVGVLKAVADLYRLRSVDVDAAELRGLEQPGYGARGPVIARFGRRVDGVEVFRSELKVVLDASHELVALSVKQGDHVQAGQVVAAIEVMKAKHDVRAPCAGRITRIDAALGDSVSAAAPIMLIAP